MFKTRRIQWTRCNHNDATLELEAYLNEEAKDGYVLYRLYSVIKWQHAVGENVVEDDVELVVILCDGNKLGAVKG